MRLHALDHDRGVVRAVEVHRGRNLFDIGCCSSGFGRDRLKVEVRHEVDRFALHDVARFAAVHGCSALNARDGFVQHVAVDFFGFPAHFNLHFSRRGDDVAAFARAKRADVDARHALAVTGNAEEREGRGRGGAKRIAAHFRLHAGVGRRSLERKVNLRRAEELFRRRHHFADRNVAADVNRVEEVDVVENAALSNRTAAAGTLFARLKDELERAAEVFLVGDDPFGNRHQNGLMAVMAASVHEARALRSVAALHRPVLGVRGFGDADAVELGANRHHGAGTARVENADNARDAVEAVENFGLDALLLRIGERISDLLRDRAGTEVRIDHFTAAERADPEAFELFDRTGAGEKSKASAL